MKNWHNRIVLNYQDYKLFQSCAFERLCESKVLKKLVIEFEYTKLIGEPELKAISNCRKLTDLKLSCHPAYNANLTEQKYVSIFENGNLKNLLHLDLYMCDNLNDQVMKTISENCPKLESLMLHISYSELNNFGNVGLAAISQLRNLKELCLNNIVSLGKENLISLFANQNLKKLTSVKLNCCKIDNDDVILITIATNCPEIQLLSITNVKPYGSYVYYSTIEFLIKHLKKLNCLIIDSCSLSDVYIGNKSKEKKINEIREMIKKRNVKLEISYLDRYEGRTVLKG